MSKRSKASKQDSSAPQCDVCGSPSSAGGSYHHFTVSIPGDDEDALWRVAKAVDKNRLRTFGPDDLINMVNERQNIGGFTVLAAAVQRLQPGDFVKLCVRVTDRTPVWLDDKMRAMAKHTASETMIVKITSVAGDSGDGRFEGQLMNMPFFVAPDILQRGSKIRFGPEHVHSIYMLKEMTQ